MCGIAGIFSFDNTRDLKDPIQKMAAKMTHRGPNAGSCLVDGQAALGHRRLSIIDLSDTANQPFADSSGRYQLIFNGELYNFEEVKAKFPDQHFKTTGDTEVLVEAFARWGIECIHHFKGMFAFAIWDTMEKELYIARDRLGVKPVYYYADDNVFVFASEVRALLASGLVKRQINSQAIPDYLSLQSVPSPASLIKGVSQLENGHYLKIKHNSVVKTCYWDLTQKSPAPDYSSATEVKTRIRELMLKSVEMRMISDVPLGAFLSGGIDSSIVVGLMAAVSNQRPNTFTVSFEEKEYDESKYADLVARKFNAVHHTILLKPTALLDELDNALNAMDTPSGDGINTYVVSKAVKNAGLTVALSGIGGDELFAGYPFFEMFRKLKNMSGLWNNSLFLRRMIARTMRGKARLLLQKDRVDIGKFYPLFRQIFSPAELKRLINGSWHEQSEVEKYLADHGGHINNFPTLSQISIAELMGYTQHTLLKDTDQMSMAVSLEVREPFFDHELIEYVVGIPDSLKSPAYPKKLLVESFEGLLPAEIVHRRKQGFSFPWNSWLRTSLHSFVETSLKNLCDRNLFNSDLVMHLWKRFLKNDRRVNWMQIWLLVVLEQWLERNEIT